MDGLIIAFALLTFLTSFFFLVVEFALRFLAFLTRLCCNIQKISKWAILTSFLLFVINHLLRTLFTKAGSFIQMLYPCAEEACSVSKVEHGTCFFTLITGIVFKINIRLVDGAVLCIKFGCDLKHFESILFFCGWAIVPVSSLQIILVDAVVEIGDSSGDFFEKLYPCPAAFRIKYLLNVHKIWLHVFNGSSYLFGF